MFVHPSVDNILLVFHREKTRTIELSQDNELLRRKLELTTRTSVCVIFR